MFGSKCFHEVFSDCPLYINLTFASLVELNVVHDCVAIINLFLLSLLLLSDNLKLVNKDSKKYSIDNGIEYIDHDHY